MPNDFGFKPEKKKQDSFGFVPETPEELGFTPIEAEEPKQPKKTEEEDDSSLEAAGIGALQGATLGWADEIAAATTAAFNTAANALSDNPDSKSYSKRKEEQLKKIRDYIQDLEKKNPKAFVGGELAGGIASLFVPGGAAAKGLAALAKGAGTATKAAKAAKAIASTGALSGALTGAGYSEGEDAEEVAKDAAIGSLFGMLPVGIGKAAKTGLKKVGQMARNTELRALGFTTRKLDKLGAQEQQKLAKAARDAKILTSNAEETAENAMKLRNNASEALGNFIESIPKSKNTKLLDKTALLNKIQKEVSPLYTKGDTPAAKKLVKQLTDAIRKVDPKDFKSIREIRSAIGRHTSPTEHTQQSLRSAASHIYKVYNELLDEGMDSLGNKINNPQLKETYKKLNTEYRLANNIASAAEAEAKKGPGSFMKELRKPLGAITPAGLGLAAGYSSEDPTTGILTGAGVLLSKRYGPSMVSKVARILSKGGPAADKVVELARAGNIKQLAALAGGKLSSEARNKEEEDKQSRSESVRNILSSLKQPE